MNTESHPLYEKNTLEFTKVAYEYCAWLERISENNLYDFVDQAVKILPLLYLKGTLLPIIDEPDEESEAAHFINEETYEGIKNRIAALLGEYDSYLETFLPDMQYSDSPIIAFISENLADIYQDLGNFVALFREEHEAAMLQALYTCSENFRLYWGQSAVNALKALHNIRYNEELGLTKHEE